MKTLNRPTSHFPSGHADSLQARFSLRVAACLNEQAEQIPSDVGERLRFAREQALAKAREKRTATLSSAQNNVAVTATSGRKTAALLLGGGGTPWWLRLASVMPLAVLVGGLVLIEQVHDRAQINAAADVDAQLLADDLPPSAYSDPGFVEFLKTPQE